MVVVMQARAKKMMKSMDWHLCLELSVLILFSCVCVTAGKRPFTETIGSAFGNARRHDPHMCARQSHGRARM